MTCYHENCDPSCRITVLRSDIKHILNVYIANGMVEEEDEEIVNRLWRQVHANSKV